MAANSQDLGLGITQIDAEYVNPGVAVLYLMEQDGKLAIIETGTQFSVPAVMQIIQQKGLTPEDVEYVIPTHVHLDHAGGAGEFMELCPNAKLVVHPAGARHLIDPSKLIAGVKAVYGEEAYHRMYGDLKPVPAERVIEAPDHFEIFLNGRKLMFLDTPGHARHHFCIWDETSAGIFTGDTFGLGYPKLEGTNGPFLFATTTPVQFEPDAMINSIDRLLALNPERMYLTHAGMVKPDANQVKQLKDSLTAFVTMAEQQPTDNFDLPAVEHQMMEYLLARVRAHGSELPEQELRDWLAMDVHLNSQGLEVWRKRQAA